MKLRLTFICVFTAFQAYADWPQWRGPDRYGVSSDTTPLVSTLPPEGFKKMWESGAIPSDHYGGHSSPAVKTAPARSRTAIGTALL